MNFVDYMGDVALCILLLLDDPADIIRACVVSHSWRRFIIKNGLSKRLCLEKAPSLSNITSTTEITDVGLIWYLNTKNWWVLEREHRIYSSFLHALSMSTFSPKDCVECVIGASSTDQPHESEVHVLYKGDSYWSSEGQTDPNLPERIIFKLSSRVCIINEIYIRPPTAYGETGSRIYSAYSVRFQMGHPRSSVDFNVDLWSLPMLQIEDKYVWTYTSPEFPMTQECYLQPFKLPEPVVCLGGYLQIEFLGRALSDESDGFDCLRMGHVRVRGHHLSPAFNVEMRETGSLCLMFCPDAFNSVFERISHVEEESREGGS